jgi:hypothetical protein
MEQSQEKPKRLGIKRVSADNWWQVDEAWRGTIMCPDPYREDQVNGWVETICQVQLDAGVPDEIRDLFEVARGAYVYSLPFYPLLTLGAEQLFRVVEAAVALHYKNCVGPDYPRKFKGRIDWLLKHAKITRDIYLRLDAVRVL